MYSFAEVKIATARAAAAAFKPGQKVRVRGQKLGTVTLVDAYDQDIKFLVEFPETTTEYPRELFYRADALEAA